jgi:molybdate transport system substrate-binding protein
VRRARVSVLGISLGLAAAVAARGAETLSIAAASNLTYALEALDAEFRNTSPSVDVTTTAGASGSLVAQIRDGAPYDVFLSADLEFAEALVKSGSADAGSLTPFAVGRLVIWTVKPGVDISDIAATVRSPAVRVLAIASPDSAPYGRAARQALEKLGLWPVAVPKLVTAENISQATQFVETGNADAGFVALSAVVSPRLRGKGRWLEVPAGLYEPLTQVAVITSHGSANPQSARFVAFLGSAAARRVLNGFGYGVPLPSARARDGK